MTRIHKAFDDLIARHPEGDSGAILASARHEVTSNRSRSRTSLGLAAAAIVLATTALAGVVVAIRDEPGSHLRAGQGPVSRTTPALAPTVRVFFTEDKGDGCKRVSEVTRPIPGDSPSTPEQQATTALRGLLDGPTDVEAARGLTSPFENAGDTLRSVTVANGATTVDFDRRITETAATASNSCGKESVQAELSATLSNIEGLGPRRFTIDGDPDAFYAWLNIDRPEEALPISTTTTSATPPKTVPDSEVDTYGHLGACRSLLPTAFDPIKGPELPPSGRTGPVPDVPADDSLPSQRPDTPCSRLLGVDLANRLGSGWSAWTNNPSGDHATSELSSPSFYGTAVASMIDGQGVVVQVIEGYGSPDMTPSELAAWGSPVEGLPDGWVGVTNFVANRPATPFKVTVVKPGTIDLAVTVQHGAPGGSKGLVALDFDEVKTLAIAIAVDGPVVSP